MISIIAIILFLAGVILFIISLVYARKIDWKKKRMEYQTIVTGSRFVSDLEDGSKLDRRHEAWRMYKSESLIKAEDKIRELTTSEREIFKKVEKELEETRHNSKETELIAEPGQKPAWNVETTALNVDGSNQSWDNCTQVLDDITEILIDED